MACILVKALLTACLQMVWQDRLYMLHWILCKSLPETILNNKRDYETKRCYIGRKNCGCLDVPKNIGYEHKRMFGGHCFMVDDKMLMGTYQGGLMVRVDPETMEDLLNKKE